jgi:RNA polymerase sigma factor (sigma-70 family)
LLCSDWHHRGPEPERGLAKVFVSWRRIRRRDAAYAYATRTPVNTYLADKRLKRVNEVLTARLPDRPAEDTGPENRMLVLSALASLPAKARAVVVLRYWEDLSVDQAAQVLGCAPGNIKSQSARALDKLRAGRGRVGIRSARAAGRERP